MVAFGGGAESSRRPQAGAAIGNPPPPEHIHQVHPEGAEARATEGVGRCIAALIASAATIAIAVLDNLFVLVFAIVFYLVRACAGALRVCVCVCVRFVPWLSPHMRPRNTMHHEHFQSFPRFPLSSRPFFLQKGRRLGQFVTTRLGRAERGRLGVHLNHLEHHHTHSFTQASFSLPLGVEENHVTTRTTILIGALLATGTQALGADFEDVGDPQIFL